MLLAEHDFNVVGSVGDGEALLEHARHLRPDVIVTDISMPAGPSGLDVLSRLKAERIESKVIVLTMHNDPALATQSHPRGCVRLPAEALGRRGARDRHSPCPAGPDLPDRGGHQGRHGAAGGAPGDPERSLTERQREVLRLIVEGRRMKEIGAALDLSTRTVETHKYEMMRVLGVHSTAELVRYAHRTPPDRDLDRYPRLAHGGLSSFTDPPQ